MKRLKCLAGGALAGMILCLGTSAHEPLTFEERVAAQEAVERVYYAHRIWPEDNPGPKPPFEQMVPRSVIEAKVSDTIKKSNALGIYWQRPISAKQLQAEIDRMARDSQDPDLLLELFGALNNDPRLIAECLARPVLADRLIHNWYAYDTRFHAETRRLAEEARDHADPHNLQAWPEGRHSQIIYRLEAADRGPRRDEPNGPVILHLAADDYAEAVGRAPALGATLLREEPEAFVLERTHASSETEFTLERLVFEKTPFGIWWDGVKAGMAGVLSKSALPDGGQSHAIPPVPEQACVSGWRQSALNVADVPDPRYGHCAVWTGTEMIVWGGDGSTGGRYDPTTDTWRGTSTGEGCPVSRSEFTTVWTGTEMIIWGGKVGSSTTTRSGGRYDPVSDTWTPTTIADSCPQPRYGHTAIWTGVDMIIWGGYMGGGGSYTDTGGKYDPVTDTWTSTSTQGACPTPRRGHVAVWAQPRMIVWGGIESPSYDWVNTGGIYDPWTDIWQEMSMGDACPTSENIEEAVWTGREMIVWGGWDRESGEYVDTGARYDPEDDGWNPTATEGAPEGRIWPTVVWTGSEMIVWGGYEGVEMFGCGGRYHPGSDSWTEISRGISSPEARTYHTAVWTGSEMIIWGGIGSTVLNSGSRYDPETDSWVATSEGSSPGLRQGHTAVWTGAEMVVWGGGSGGFCPRAGGLYSPALDAWAQTSTGSNCPEGRRGLTGIWTGREMIVWGGAVVWDEVGSGGRYDPAADSWEATSEEDPCPTERNGHTAVWTGSEMIVWGGDGNTGGRYDPDTDTWRPTSTGSGCPAHGDGHSAVWTGSEMIVWGGYDTNEGGRYDASSDAWAATSTGGYCPQPRLEHSAVWTGSEMIIWGGVDTSAYDVLSSGGRYDPGADAWSAMAADGHIPIGRNAHSTVWTGSQMLVWGGQQEYPYDDGGVMAYLPSDDAWIRYAPDGATPSPRYNHTAVWAGSEMIVWGGSPATVTGGIFSVLPERISLDPEAFPTAGIVPLRVAFDARAVSAGCIGEPACRWDFGDGAASGEPSPEHTYWTEGTYAWRVTATLNGVVETREGTITVLGDPCGGFTCAAAAAPAEGTAPMEVSFSASAEPASCSGPVSFAWDFGDGGASPEPAADHVYERAGTYIWTMEASIEGVACSRSGTITVLCDPPAVRKVRKLREPFRLKIDVAVPLTEGWAVFLDGQDSPWPHVRQRDADSFVIKKASGLFRKDGSETVIEIVNGDGCSSAIAYNREEKSWRPLSEAGEAKP